MRQSFGQRLIASGLMLLFLGQQVPLVISLPELQAPVACHHREADLVPGIVACPHHSSAPQAKVSVHVAGLGEIALLVCNCRHDAPAHVFTLVIDRWVLPRACSLACPEGRPFELLPGEEMVLALRLAVDIFHPPRLVG